MVREFVNSPAFGLIVAAILAELRIQQAKRQARRERAQFREELASLVASDHNNEGVT